MEVPQPNGKQKFHWPTVGGAGGLVGALLVVHAQFIMPQVLAAARDITRNAIKDHEEHPHRGAADQVDIEKLETQVRELVKTTTRIETKLEVLKTK